MSLDFSANSSAATSQFLTRSEAALFLTERGLKISAATLAALASKGGGPLYRRFNGFRAVYQVSDLEAWAIKRLGRPLANSVGAGQ